MCAKGCSCRRDAVGIEDEGDSFVAGVEGVPLSRGVVEVCGCGPVARQVEYRAVLLVGSLLLDKLKKREVNRYE